MSDEQNIQTIRSVYEMFNSRDTTGLMGLVTDDFELIDVALGLTWTGKPGWQEWLSNWAVSIPDAMTRMDSLIAAGDTIVTEHTGTGTHTGPLQTPAGTIPPTGKAIKLQFAEIFTMRDGKIRQMKAYWDSATLMRQLGLIP
jgi:steroid delta-isomerase-like uncharacterized protein